jgi:hypothetical protein
MAKKDIGLIKQFGMTISEYASDEVRSQVFEGSERLNKCSRTEISTWLRGAMERFDRLVDEKIRYKIMEDCGHNCAAVNKRTMDQMRRKREEFGSLEEFIDYEVRNPSKIQRIERDGGHIFQVYSPKDFGKGWRCFCALWSEMPTEEETSTTWCQCSRAFVQKVWEMYTGKPVRVELVESSISGATECIFEIHL